MPQLTSMARQERAEPRAYETSGVKGSSPPGIWCNLNARIGREVSGCLSVDVDQGYFVSSVSSGRSPNKALEPTPGLVTPRAIECTFEVKRRIGNRDVARGAPSPVVAHL